MNQKKTLYLRKEGTKRIFVYSDVLSKKPDMLPCCSIDGDIKPGNYS